MFAWWIYFFPDNHEILTGLGDLSITPGSPCYPYFITYTCIYWLTLIAFRLCHPISHENIHGLSCTTLLWAVVSCSSICEQNLDPARFMQWRLDYCTAWGLLGSARQCHWLYTIGVILSHWTMDGLRQLEIFGSGQLVMLVCMHHLSILRWTSTWQMLNEEKADVSR